MSSQVFRSTTSGLPLAALFLALAVLTTPAAEAQTGTVQGRVMDGATRRPLTDAQVIIVTTDMGQSANSSGVFLFPSVPAGNHTIRVTLIGYGEQERDVTVTAGATATVDFELSPTAISLDEIVVTGVGAQTTRRALGTSVDVLRAEDFELAPVQSVDQLLQGRVAGATVSATSAQPGTGSLINFRGVSSVFSSQTPVIYVDGVRVDNSQATAAGTGGEQSSALSDLMSSDIERIEVTRGGAASTLYGSDAATGVIQIFTKKGTPGAPRIVTRMEQGIEQPQLWNILDVGKIFPSIVESGDASATFLRDNYFKRGNTQNYYVGVSGGSGLITYNVSGRLEDKTGTQPKDGSTNYTMRGGMQASITDDFTLEFSGSLVRHNFGRLYNGTAISDPVTTFEVGDALFFSRASTLSEALDIFLMPDISEWVNRFIFSSGFRWDIGDNLGAKLTLGTDNRANQQRTFEPIGFTPGEVTGDMRRFDRTFTSVSMDGGVTYSWQHPERALGSQLTVGVQGFREEVSIVLASGRTFALPGATDFDAAAEIDAFEVNSEVFNGGIYVDEQLSLWDKLYLGGGFRIDAGSSFGDNIDTELYPKGTVSYILSEDLSLPGFDELKLRGAYGQTGKFPGAFLKDRTFAATRFRGEAAARFSNPGNAELRPERTSTIEAGVDAALWGDRVGLNATVYEARTTDALFSVPRQPVTGMGTQQENVGEILNRGVELATNVVLLNRQNFAWSVGGTFQYNHNQVTDMGGVADFFVDPQKRVTGCWTMEEEGNEDTCVGGPVGAWYVTTPIDTNGDGLPDGSEFRFSGSFPTPDKSGGVNTTVSVGNNLTVSAIADWAGGHDVFDFGSVWATFNGIYRREIVRCGTGETSTAGCDFAFPTQYDAAGVAEGKYSQSAARRAFLYDGDYFKLREVSVRWILPENVSNLLGARRATLYGTGRNLYMWSANKLVDGELNGLSSGGLELGGESSITLSPNRALRLGVEVVF